MNKDSVIYEHSHSLNSHEAGGRHWRALHGHVPCKGNQVPAQPHRHVSNGEIVGVNFSGEIFR